FMRNALSSRLVDLFCEAACQKAARTASEREQSSARSETPVMHEPDPLPEQQPSAVAQGGVCRLARRIFNEMMTLRVPGSFEVTVRRPAGAPPVQQSAVARSQHSMAP